MKSSSKFFPGLSLFLILVGIYLFTYTGVPVSNDENFLFDTTQGFVRRGEFRLTTLFDLRSEPRSFYLDYLDGLPWPAAPQEPLQPILAAPLFALAERLPAI